MVRATSTPSPTTRPHRRDEEAKASISNNQPSRFTAWRLFVCLRLRLYEIAFVPVHFDQFASRIVNVDHSIMCAAVMFRVFDCITGLQVPQPAKRQPIRDQIKATPIFARSNFVSVHRNGAVGLIAWLDRSGGWTRTEKERHVFNS